ncbi:Nucleotide-binding alpha-beta plait domain containing protein [Trema orientale]|uniref:Nucleotide-binding alpha-beta plait domain containing protein n=1 Tax=Trema orientale TaxID=63057 RepID=A0A2P5CFQ5_TREOI|nr:Nucleotide-binding alpha-beta plait domain containing protein [Trema orientale]
MSFVLLQRGNLISTSTSARIAHPPPPPPAAALALAFPGTPPQVNVEGLSRGTDSQTLRELLTPHGHIVTIVIHSNSGGRFVCFRPRVEKSCHHHLCQ